jgi:lipid-binding SYLF domain-containing protein
MSKFITTIALALMFLLPAACSTTPDTAGKRADLKREAESTLAIFRQENADIADAIDDAYGYAVFPGVGKGGLVVGGSFGRGIVYEQGEPIGYATVTKGSFGAQIGGQAFRQIVLFQNKDALARFKTGDVAFSADANAVIVEAGAGVAVPYRNGVAVLVMPKGGAMVEASIGGQGFDYEDM